MNLSTGQLDRVVHGMSAEEILNACDESVSMVPTFQEGGLANPAVHFFRGLKHRNIAAIRHAAMVILKPMRTIFEKIN